MTPTPTPTDTVDSNGHSSTLNEQIETIPFARIETFPELYKIWLSLDYFASFKENDINVHLKGRNVTVDCKKGRMEKPDSGLRTVHILYRLPEDVDEDTVKMERKGHQVHIEAQRADYGRPLTLAVCDVTNHNPDLPIITHM